MASDDSYLAHVDSLELTLGDFAFRSREIETFTDGTDAVRSFEAQWRTDEGTARLTGRTPLMVERDRVLWSDELRRQADKYHLLFHGGQRVSRDYTTHTLRVAHVARSVSRRLGLNTDLAEAVALGCKVGAVPFLHVAKATVDRWVRDRLKDIDDAAARKAPRAARVGGQEPLLLVEVDGTLVLPDWVSGIRDDGVRDGVAKFLPWAAGSSSLPAYSSGQQSYWLLSTDPFLLRPKAPYVPQTMYGVWRHSLGGTPDSGNFRHSITLSGAGAVSTLTLTESHLTHEAVVVRYADDITWVIENLNEANRAAALGGVQNSVFNQLALQLSGQDPPTALSLALQPRGNTGSIYTYFIDDLVRTSNEAFGQAHSTHRSETEPLVGLSPTAARMLRLMKEYLRTGVFNEDRVRLRNDTLGVISKTILDLLYESQAQVLVDLIERRGKLDMWGKDETASALILTDDPAHRVQASVDALSLMSDREVYELIGLDAA